MNEIKSRTNAHTFVNPDCIMVVNECHSWGIQVINFHANEDNFNKFDDTIGVWKPKNLAV